MARRPAPSARHIGSPTCRRDDPDSPDFTGRQPPSPAPSRKRQARVMTVQVCAVLGLVVIRRAGSIAGASTAHRRGFPAGPRKSRPARLTKQLVIGESALVLLIRPRE